jgi:hypothetical protein
MKFHVYNHNGTFLGSFKSYKKAEKEAVFYRQQTGNEAKIVDMVSLNMAKIFKELKP